MTRKVSASKKKGLTRQLTKQTFQLSQKLPVYDCDFAIRAAMASKEMMAQKKLEIEAANQAIQQNPNDAKNYYRRALQLYSEEAITDLTRAIELDKNFEAAYFERGNRYKSFGRYDQANEDFTAVIKINPKNIEALQERGGGYFSARKYDLAITDLTAYLKLQTDPHVYYLRAHAYSESGYPGQAIADFTKLMQLCPNNDEQYRWFKWRGQEFVKKGDVGKAIFDYTRAIRYDSQDASLYFLRGQAYAANNKLRLAITDFNRSIKFDPEYFAAYGERGVIYRKLGRPDQAIADLTLAIENISENWKIVEPQTYANWFLQRSLAYKAKGELQKAAEDLKRFKENRF